jgi:hypothetical protein
MAKKMALLGILMMALILGMIGCRDNPAESLLNGTWLAANRVYFEESKNEVGRNIENYDCKITFYEGDFEESVYNGTFEESFGNSLVCKGIYKALGRDINMRVTHIYGEYLGLEARWCSIVDDGIKQAVINEKFSELPLSLSLAVLPPEYNYSVTTDLQMTTTVVDGDQAYAVTTTYRRIVEVE